MISHSLWWRWKRSTSSSIDRWKVIWGSPRDLGGSPSVGGQRWIPGGWKVNCGSRAVVEPPGVPEFCEGSSTGPGGSQGIWGSAHRSTPWCAFWSGMDALDEYGSSDNESAGAPASNAVPAALTSPPGSPSIRNAAQALVQFSQGAAHQVTAQHKPRPRLVVPERFGLFIAKKQMEHYLCPGPDRRVIAPRAQFK